MLAKIKSLKEILEPVANKLGNSFEFQLSLMTEDQRFKIFLRQYNKKINQKNHSDINKILYISNDCKLIIEYLKDNYFIKDTKYSDLFINNLLDVIKNNEESMLYWRDLSLLSNEDDSPRPFTSNKIYEKLKFKDISFLLKKLNLKPLYHLTNTDVSSVINDNEYKDWLTYPLSTYMYLNPFDDTKIQTTITNLRHGVSLSPIKQIYRKYIEFIVEKILRKNIILPANFIGNKITFTSHLITKHEDDIINQIISANPNHFKRNEYSNVHIKPIVDYKFDIMYNVPIPTNSSELSVLINHFSNFKKLINDIFQDSKVMSIYYKLRRGHLRSMYKTTHDRASAYSWHGDVYPQAYDRPDGPEGKYLSFLRNCLYLEYYINEPDELITYCKLEYPHSETLPAAYFLRLVLNEKSYWSKSIKKWSEEKFNDLFKRVKLLQDNANLILKQHGLTERYIYTN